MGSFNPAKRVRRFTVFFVLLFAWLSWPVLLRAAQLTSVQSGTTTIASGTSSATVTITAVTTSHAFVVFSARLGSTIADPVDGQVSGQITNATTLTFARKGTVGNINIKWYVAEFPSGVTVQRGAQDIAGATTNITITSVDTTKSFVLISARTTGSTFGRDDYFEARLTSATNLQLNIAGLGATSPTVEWQVVQYTDSSVQSGQVSFATTDTSKTASVTSVDTSKSWLIYSYQLDDNAIINPNVASIRGQLTNSTTLTFDRYASGNAATLTYFLVQFTDGTTVQSGSQNFATTDTQNNATITSVSTSWAIAAAGLYVRGGRTAYATDDNPNPVWFTLDLTSATNLQITRDVTGSSAADVGWFVVQFVANPTAVKLISFEATEREQAQVLLQWRTGYEVDNLGFHVYREQEGKLRRVTPSLVAGSAFLAAKSTALSAGRSYIWIDALPQGTGPVQYWLEDWDLSGKRTMHGPVRPVYSDEPPPEKNQAVPEGSQPLQQQEPVQLSEVGRWAGKHDPEGATPSSAWNVAPRRVMAASQDGKKDPSAERLTTQWELASQPAMKIAVRKEGWYRVSQPKLAAAGLPAGVDPRKLQLFADGVEQSIVVKVKSDWKFDAGDWIEFYGTGLDTLWTDRRTYWLVEGKSQGKRVQTVTGAGVRSSTASFPYTVEKKDRTVYFAALLNGENDNFFGSVVTTVPTDEMVEVHHLDPQAPGDAQLEVRLQGATFQVHSVAVLVNGIEVGTVGFKDQELATGRLRVPSVVLKSGENTVRLIARGGEMDVSLVDVLRLTCWHIWTADGAVQMVTLQAGQAVTMAGFASPGIRAVDVSDPNSPVELRGVVTLQSQGYAITLATGGLSGEVLFFTDAGLETPAAISANRPSNWNQAGAGADVVIISHSSFLPSLEVLKAAQEREGWKVALVDVGDCYDEFSFGAQTPLAIKDFLVRARSVWRKVPKYLLLAGDASVDLRNYLGLGGFDFVPTKMIDTKYLETLSDDWFADFDRTGFAQMAVGRLPARTATETSTMVTKILSFRQRDQSASWTKQALLVADQGDPFDFEAASAHVRVLLPGTMSVKEVYRGRLGAATRDALLQSLNQGSLLVNYAGHGSVDLWRGNVLTSSDAYTLTNQNRLPLFVIMDCLNGYFADVYSECLGEALMKARTGGAVGVWASSGLTEPDQQALMNHALYGYLFQPGMTVGEAIVRAKAMTKDADVRRTWEYLGDPTLKLRPVQ